MLSVEKLVVEECINSLYIRPFRLSFQQNGKPRKWDLMKSHDSVSVVIFHKERDSLLFVQQFRPAVFYNNIHRNDEIPAVGTVLQGDPARGLTVELCAGIVDKAKSLREIAAEEVLEEVGFNVLPEQLEKVAEFRNGIGITGALQTIFYTEVTESMRLHSGGGNPDDGEFIETVEIPVSQARDFIFDENHNKPTGIAFGIMWFLDSKYKPAILKVVKKHYYEIAIVTSAITLSTMLIGYGLFKYFSKPKHLITLVKVMI